MLLTVYRMTRTIKTTGSGFETSKTGLERAYGGVK
jgi:hypothetical protein